MKASLGLPIIGAMAGRAEVLGYDPQALNGMPLSVLCPLCPPDGQPSAETLEGVLAEVQQAGALNLPLTERDGEPQPAVCMVDASRMQFAEVLNQAQNELLEMVATGLALKPVLERLTALIESQFDGLYCTVLLLLDPDGRRVRVGAEIGPTAGSCGTAMFDDRLVIVDNIATHPLWAQYRDLALPYFYASLSIAAYGFLMAQQLRHPEGVGKRNGARIEEPAVSTNSATHYKPRGSPAHAAPRPLVHHNFAAAYRRSLAQDAASMPVLSARKPKGTF